MFTIVPMVEGQGDVAALPPLLGRILLEMYNRSDVVVGQGRNMVVKTNGRSNLESSLDKFLDHAQSRPDCGAILILLDADDDCPVTLARHLWQRCQEIGTRCPVQVVCAHREYESWILASLETIRDRAGIPDNASFAGDADAVPNPKQWLTDRMGRGQAYKETTDQPSLSSRIDLELQANSRSFRRLCHAVEQLLEAAGPAPDC